MKTPWIIIILLAFIFNTLGPLPKVQAQDFVLPKPGVMVHLSPPKNLPILKGIKVHADNPFRFDFILDKGDVGAIHESPLHNDSVLKEESSKLIKYFLASLTIPEKDLWVNLSPYEKDRIIPQSFGLTEMGRDLLAEDYMLKQITASLIYPEDEVGKKFWKRIYEEAAKKYGTTNIPVNTFNKVWIVPEKAVVYENAKAGTAYVVESRLKVMLEQDYLSIEKHVTTPNDTGSIGVNIIREIVIPELTKEINEGANFAQLRQVYNSLILATWYKKKIKDSILSQVYADKNKTAGIEVSPESSLVKHEARDVSRDTINDTEYIYQNYLKAFKKGVYNYIKEEKDSLTQQLIPRKYFSGGAVLDLNEAMTTLPMNRREFFEKIGGGALKAAALAFVSVGINIIPVNAEESREISGGIETMMDNGRYKLKVLKKIEAKEIVSYIAERYFGIVVINPDQMKELIEILKKENDSFQENIQQEQVLDCVGIFNKLKLYGYLKGSDEVASLTYKLDGSHVKLYFLYPRYVAFESGESLDISKDEQVVVINIKENISRSKTLAFSKSSDRLQRFITLIKNAIAHELTHARTNRKIIHGSYDLALFENPTVNRVLKLSGSGNYRIKQEFAALLGELSLTDDIKAFLKYLNHLSFRRDVSSAYYYSSEAIVELMADHLNFNTFYSNYKGSKKKGSVSYKELRGQLKEAKLNAVFYDFLSSLKTDEIRRSAKDLYESFFDPLLLDTYFKVPPDVIKRFNAVKADKATISIPPSTTSEKVIKPQLTSADGAMNTLAKEEAVRKYVEGLVLDEKTMADDGKNVRVYFPQENADIVVKVFKSRSFEFHEVDSWIRYFDFLKDQMGQILAPFNYTTNVKLKIRDVNGSLREDQESLVVIQKRLNDVSPQEAVSFLDRLSSIDFTYGWIYQDKLEYYQVGKDPKIGTIYLRDLAVPYDDYYSPERMRYLKHVTVPDLMIPGLSDWAMNSDFSMNISRGGFIKVGKNRDTLSSSKAMTTDEAMRGGIDLTSNKFIQTQSDDQDIKFHLDSAQLQQLQNALGFVPIIINIQPLTDLKGFLGINDVNPPQISA